MEISETIDCCIESTLKTGNEIYGKELDFSDESVSIVNNILDGYHDNYLGPYKDDGFIKDHFNTYSHIFGVYIGEDLCRNHANDFIWKNTEFGIFLQKTKKTLSTLLGKDISEL